MLEPKHVRKMTKEKREARTKANHEAIVGSSSVIPGIYEHYSGRRYLALMTAKNEENLEPMVVYISLDDDPALAWVRPVREFIQYVEQEIAGTVPRFKLLRALEDV